MWLPPLSATNSFAARKTSKELREGKSPASWFAAARSVAAAKIRGLDLQHLHSLVVRNIFQRVPCSFTAEAGRICRGALAPQRSYPGTFFSRFFSKFKNSAARRKTPPPLISNFYFLISICRAGLSLAPFLFSIWPLAWPGQAKKAEAFLLPASPARGAAH